MILVALLESIQIPKVLYHGSPRRFSKFSLEYRGRVDDGYHGEGIYLTPDVDEANDYGPILYTVHLVRAKPFWLFDDGTHLSVPVARKQLSKLARYGKHAPDSRIPGGYELVLGSNFTRYNQRSGRNEPLTGKFAVHPTPAKYGDPNVIYGEWEDSPEAAAISFNDERKYGYGSGPSSRPDTISLLKQFGRRDFAKVLAEGGYNCLFVHDDASVTEVMVIDPSIIHIDSVQEKRNEYDLYY